MVCNRSDFSTIAKMGTKVSTYLLVKVWIGSK